MRFVILYFSFILFFGACTSAHKLIETGNYDQAIQKLCKKLAGSRNKSREDVVDLEFAFKKAQERDLNLESEFLLEDDDVKWEKIYNIHTRIEDRQRKVEALVPLVSKDGYKAGFHFINTSERKKESKSNSAEYFYKSAVRLLTESQNTGDKQSAREAYDFAVKIQNLYSNYKDVNNIKRQAQELGTNYYLVRMLNNTQTVMPIQMENALLNISVAELDKNWKKFDMRPNPNIKYDYHIIMNLTNLDFSPERERIRLIEDVFEIEEEELLVDKKGKPILDSLGKKQYTKIKVKYPYTVEEITQLKSAILGGRLEWINLSNKNIEFTRPLNVEAVFDNKFGRLMKGDREKIHEEVQKILRGRAMPFPSNENMILDAGEKLKFIVKDFIFERER
ncbi:MAG: hypothetical protein IPM48_05340 [Saprospiraceae bacterium]|nr:hypothetical protein [Saprospiraceae bacterium]